MSDLFIDIWGTGTPVVLVHGSLATGAEEWEAQRPLADEGFRLLVLDRRGYGRSPMVEGEDFLRDAEDIAEVMGDGAHLVGHSYGGLGVLFAAARRPEGDPITHDARAGRVRVGSAPSRGEGARGRGSANVGSGPAGRGLGRPLPQSGGK
jgi:pimeloyl-ACP methyl ester carboxylesterase